MENFNLNIKDDLKTFLSNLLLDPICVDLFPVLIAPSATAHPLNPFFQPIVTIGFYSKNEREKFKYCFNIGSEFIGLSEPLVNHLENGMILYLKKDSSNESSKIILERKVDTEENGVKK